MVLRKGKLQRPCIKCGNNFEPTGRSNRICLNCKPKSPFAILYGLKA